MYISAMAIVSTDRTLKPFPPLSIFRCTSISLVMVPVDDKRQPAPRLPSTVAAGPRA